MPSYEKAIQNNEDQSAPIASFQIISQIRKSNRYEPAVINLEDKNNSHVLIIEMTGRNKRVLEIGTSTGYVTKILKERGNLVTGIEVDKDAADIAKQYCETMIVKDIEEVDLASLIEPSSFDVVILGDVLEHLRWPGRLLFSLKSSLREGGYLVVSLPNVCHADLLLNLLNGDFRYTSVGLLDETHLRFFARRNIIEIFSEHGYAIEELQTVHLPLGATELKMDLSKIPAEFIKLMEALPDADVYQYVFRAVPSENLSQAVVPETDFNALFSISVEDIINKHEAQVTLISEQLEQAYAQSTALSQEMSQLHDGISDRDGKISVLGEEIAQLQSGVSYRDGKISMLSTLIEQAYARSIALSQEMSQLQNGISDRDGKISVLSEEMSQLQNGISDRDGKISV
ncbi:MAG: methyltransferase domain-containing protein, partial [Methanotrichaceae archaeon]|nr:methyltransferase domain-containing protein [Methanotrichaceae archaeon]